MQLPEILDSWIPTDDTRLFGEVLLSRCDKRGFKACHLRDRELADGELTMLESIAEIREIPKYCEKGEYRPLKTAPGLKRGWVIFETDIEQFYHKLDAIYPAAFAGSAKYFDDDLMPVALRTTLDRQTGMYEFAKNITDNQANQIMRDICAKGCLRTIAWPIDESCPVSKLSGPSRKIPIVCTEACTFVVTEAKRLARAAYDKANSPE